MTEETSKRRSGRVIDIQALGSKPSIKKFLKVEGEKYAFAVGGKKGGVRTVNRVSGPAIAKLDALAKNDNKGARSIGTVAVIIAASSKKRTVNDDHVNSAETIHRLFYPHH